MRGWLIWLKVNVLPGVVISAALLAVVTCAAELYLRARWPFVRTVWASRFDPNLGFTFAPQALIRHTNYLDFWSEQRANSLGFLDREPPASPIGKRARVLIVGDSFVEAAQVPIEKKLQVRLEGSWNQAHPVTPIETIAFGYSGTGQANQLPWLDLAQPYSPCLIVLVFVGNDFANNSPWLEAVRNGWHPDHAPRPFYRFRDGQYVWQPADPDWRRFLLPGQTGSSQAVWTMKKSGMIGVLDQAFEGRSYAYTALRHAWRAKGHRAPSYYGNVPSALVSLKTLADGKQRFGDWAPPDDLTLDEMFFAHDVPPVFEEAYRDTAFALRTWKERARTIGADVVILASHSLRRPLFTQEQYSPRLARRAIDVDRPYQRLVEIGLELGIPVIDQTAFLRRMGLEVQDASFAHDGHWNEVGHDSAARAIKEWLERSPTACRRREE